MERLTVTLNKYLADCGICSRRNAAALIKEGKVSINNAVVVDPAYRVQKGDLVRFETKVVKPQEKTYVLLNKPKGYISTVSDPYHTRTVVNLVRGVIKDRVYPVGRLDAETTGLILLTNDGDFAQKLAHPRYEVRKIYHVKLDRPLRADDMQRIRDGVRLAEGRVAVDRIYIVANNPRNFVGIELHSGINRVIRRIFAKLGYDVKQLDRAMYANLSKRGLPVGSWRQLSKKEIEQLSAD